MIDLDERCLSEVRRLLQAHVPEVEVRVFGSRVNGTASRFSDLDLVLVGAAAIAPGRLAALRDAFAASDLPIQVDVLDWHAISDSFRQVIEKNFLVLQPASGR